MSIIEETRTKLGFSKNYMAKMLGTTDIIYSKKERNILKLSLDEIIKISKILNLTMDEIVNDVSKECTSELKYKYASDNKLQIKSYIYFIKDCSRGIVKIGKSSNLINRVSSLRASFVISGVDVSNLRLIGLYPTILEDVDYVEREIQSKFSQFRKIGEWFEVSEIDIIRKFNIFKRVYGVNLIIDEMDCEKKINNSKALNEYVNLDDKKVNYKKFIEYKRETLDIENIELDILNVLKIL